MPHTRSKQPITIKNNNHVNVDLRLSGRLVMVERPLPRTAAPMDQCSDYTLAGVCIGAVLPARTAHKQLRLLDHLLAEMDQPSADYGPPSDALAARRYPPEV